MSLDSITIKKLAAHLEEAELTRTAVVKITDAHPALGIADAYLIQDEIRARKIARGARVVGFKMGFTSLAKMRQMGVSDPIFGFLTDQAMCRDGADIDTSTLIHPKVEAELALVTNRPLKGPGCHVGAVLAAIDHVLAAVEVIDSRYENFRFDLASVIADNTSAARYVLGNTTRTPAGLDLRNLGIVLEKNGTVMATASGAAVVGHPAASVAMLANLLGARGSEIPAGSLILTGGATEAFPVEAGATVTARFQHVGTVSMRFT